jgi:hypothetical protein
VKTYGKYRRKERISTTTTTADRGIYSTAATSAAINTYPRAAAAAVAVVTAAASAAAIALKFHSKHVTNKNKAKHIMKISHINVSIYDKTATTQQNSD